MLTTQRPAARGAQTDQTPSHREADNPTAMKLASPEASNAAILQSLAEVKGFLVAEIEHTAAEVKAEITVIGTRTTAIEQHMAHIVTAHNGSATLTNALKHWITDLEIELGDIFNRARHNNLRIRGLPETVGDAELEAILVKCLRQGLPDIPDHLWHVDRAHRALRALATAHPWTS
ncbi:Hypothetical predicted protein [Pelobates cultripes]|uniref:Uncharacterized protein n=1 Tax=Pelobates cultripes TaxID=61616 RepID=A0AAD1VYY7_PELCU|nr:Hypothetical predicted protein [Pelobates cultripes]